jgi:Tol biopolymer transport system component
VAVLPRHARSILAAILVAAAACSSPTHTAHRTRTPGRTPNGSAALRHLSTSPLDSIVFASDRVGFLQIYSMRADGGRETRLTDDDAIDSWPVWSLDRTRIAFASTRFGRSDVFVMAAGGGTPVRLTTNTADDYHPTWSPDGSRIAFESLRDDNAEIYVMNADGTDQTRLTTNAGLDGSPAWSPDGRLIAFESEVAGNEDIYTMHPDGSHLRRLTSAPKEDTDPAWSPDGRKIAFTSSRFGPPRLFVMNADGTGQVAISPPAGRLAGGGTGIWMDANPAWSPDGAWLAFATTRPGTLQIWAMHPDGGSLQALTRFGNNGAPSWA